MALSNMNTGPYTEGNEEQILWFFYATTAFMLMIVLLNMLIAMMGQSFGNVSDVLEASMLRERISLINENFFLKERHAFKKAKYLISFAPVQDKADSDQLMQNISDKIDHMFKELKSEIKGIKNQQDLIALGGH